MRKRIVCEILDDLDGFEPDSYLTKLKELELHEAIMDVVDDQPAEMPRAHGFVYAGRSVSWPKDK